MVVVVGKNKSADDLFCVAGNKHNRWGGVEKPPWFASFDFFGLAMVVVNY